MTSCPFCLGTAWKHIQDNQSHKVIKYTNNIKLYGYDSYFNINYCRMVILMLGMKDCHTGNIFLHHAGGSLLWWRFLHMTTMICFFCEGSVTWVSWDKCWRFRHEKYCSWYFLLPAEYFRKTFSWVEIVFNWNIDSKNRDPVYQNQAIYYLMI